MRGKVVKEERIPNGRKKRRNDQKRNEKNDESGKEDMLRQMVWSL